MSRDQSTLVKGLAILLMLIYHMPRLLGLEQAMTPMLSFMAHISNPVVYFLIVSGYGLYYAYREKRLTYPYLFKRTLRLYVSFWLVLLIFVVGLGSWLRPGMFSQSPLGHVLSFLGWEWGYLQFTWFLFPYVLISLCSPWLFRLLDRLGNILSIVITLAVSLAMTVVISRYINFLWNNMALYHVVLTAQMSFGFTIGAVMARYALAGHSLTWSRLKGRNWLVLLLLAVAFVARGLINFSTVPGFPALVIWLVLHFDTTRFTTAVMLPLGRMSMMMWFCHGYIAVKLFNEYFLMLRWPWLIWLVWVVVSYCVACLLMPVSNRISRALKLT